MTLAESLREGERKLSECRQSASDYINNIAKSQNIQASLFEGLQSTKNQIQQMGNLLHSLADSSHHTSKMVESLSTISYSPDLFNRLEAAVTLAITSTNISLSDNTTLENISLNSQEPDTSYLQSVISDSATPSISYTTVHKNFSHQNHSNQINDINKNVTIAKSRSNSKIYQKSISLSSLKI